MPYMGRILWVDLTRGTLHTENIPATFYARQLSGLGLAIGQLLDRIPAGAAPLSPDNVLAITASKEKWRQYPCQPSSNCCPVSKPDPAWPSLGFVLDLLLDYNFRQATQR